MTNSKRFTRRRFMQGVGAGVLAAGMPLVLPPRLCFGGPAAPSNRLNVALIGCGGRGAQDIEDAFHQGANVIALCDADAKRIANLRKELSKRTPAMAPCLEKAGGYEDYRQLIDREKSLDGAVIAIGPWWHAPMSSAFIRAGKHVYCEKPLTRLVTEARALGQLARESKVATQMGTQGAAGESFRRSVEIIQAGLLGAIREAHVWNVVHPVRPPSQDRPAGEDPIPDGFNWDLWVGPSPMRPFKRDTYHPGCMRAAMWLDFGMGVLGDFGVHTWQLPIRALKLGYPTRVEHNVPEPIKESYPSHAKIRYEFPARGDLPPVTGWYYDTCERPPAHVIAEIEPTYPKFPGVGAVLIGDKGSMFIGGWGGGNVMRLKGETKMHDVNHHPAAKDLPKTEPRHPKQNHMLEWIDGATGGPKPYQCFEVATHAMEVILPAIVSLRMQREIEWDGVNMKVPGAPEADRFIQSNHRAKWL